MTHTKWIICWLFFSLVILSGLPAYAAPIVNQWQLIKSTHFSNQTVIDAQKQIIIDAPKQAENAAVVPFTFKVNLENDQIDKLYVFTDANPILLTATFNMKVPQNSFNVSTRIRLDQNSIVRVIVKTKTGKYLMKTTGIKTPGGGCGGGAMTDEAKLRATAGKMKMRFIEPGHKNSGKFVLNIKHPMRTGFERTFQGYYAKAWFIQNVDFSIDYQPYFHALLGPGISADPYFSFGLPDKKAEVFQVEAKDNEGKIFQLAYKPVEH